MLNILLDDNSYEAWLLEVCDDLDCMYDYCVSVREAYDDENISIHQIERILHREYGIGNLAVDSIAA